MLSRKMEWQKLGMSSPPNGPRADDGGARINQKSGALASKDTELQNNKNKSMENEKNGTILASNKIINNQGTQTLS